MYRDGIDGGLVISPTDLTKFLGCRHSTALDLAVADGSRPRPEMGPNEALELLFRKGLEHEGRYLARLRGSTGVVEIAQGDVVAAARDTELAMRDGASVIYQATFLDSGRRGHADFLLRADRPSLLGDFAYDVADTKLARRLKVPALLQMAEYSEHLRRIQGVPAEWLTVVTGDSRSHSVRAIDVSSYYRRIKSAFTTFLDHPHETLAEEVQACAQCRWIADCSAQRRAADDLSLVAFMRGDHRALLEAAGISTLEQLALADTADLPVAIGRTSRDRLVGQARLQFAERTTGVPSYELLDAGPKLGLGKLPEPDPADLYLDFEGDPYAEPAGREYLAGIGDRLDGFQAIWAHSFDEERVLIERLVDRLLSHWQQHPGMHVYHYAPYERAALQRLTARHGVREAELDVLLRAEVLVDLYAVVRQGIRISKESYSIKKLEAFYWGHTRPAAAPSDAEEPAAVSDAMASVVAYERWLVDQDDSVLEQIRAYNAVDVQSTRALHDWLEDRRGELLAHSPSAAPRPDPDTDATPEPKEAELAEAALAARLIEAGEPLLAGLVGFHRREQRPAWWDLFRLADLQDEDLIADAAAIGGLSEPVYLRDIKRSHVHRYTFPPQDTRLRPDAQALDVATQKSAGKVVGLDPERGWIELSIGKNRAPGTPRGLGPEGPLNDQVLRAAIAEVAETSLAGKDCLGLRLVHRWTAPGLPAHPDEAPAEAVRRIGADLRGGVLAVQGPPGTGKSTAGAALIRSLLDAGLRVGITALSHAVIGNLLVKVGRPALQRCDADSHCGSDQVEIAVDNTQVAAALESGEHILVGGTAWLWARPELRESVDVLLIDEAGQFSLANAVAVSTAARSMVLLGDPQQLAQPSQTEHPDGAGVSALEHLLDGHPTVPPERGVFLSATWRLHPTITDFVSITSYEGRLHSAPDLDRQAIHGTLEGNGLRWLPVEHYGNDSVSAQEAEVVGALVSRLLAGSWTDSAGNISPLTPADILVVAPYNAHVARLRESLPPDVRVGTVDKFQGREAPVVIYSMASSSAADAPRGVDFLYDVHRLNVAVSRARAMAILVGSPQLLDAEVHTPHQLLQVNALCRYVDMATELDLPETSTERIQRIEQRNLSG